MLNWIKTVVKKISDALLKPRFTFGYKSIVDWFGEGFMQGSGLAFWSWLLMIKLFCLVTRQDAVLTFTKKK